MKKTLLHLLASLSIFLLWGCPQPEEPELTPIESEYTIGAGASDFFVKFKTNQDCKVTPDVDWLTVPSTKASVVKSVTISAEANPTTKMRTGHLTISAGTLSAKITVNQEGNEEKFIEVSPTSFEVGADGGTINPTITSNVEYQTIITVDWITKSGDAFVVAKNTEAAGRSAVITLKAGDIIKTITVTQAAAGESAVLENAGTATYTVPAEGNVIEVKVRSNVDYTVECSADWISRTETKTVRVDVLNFAVAANDGEARNATITFKYGDEMSFGVTVSQVAKGPTEDPYLEISPSEVHFPAVGGTKDVDVDANYEFTADCDDEWVTVTIEGSKIIITAAANTMIEGRTAMVMVSSEGMVEYITVKQDAAESEEDPFDVGSDLSVNGTANCYVVPKAGDFSFDASVMGNGPKGYLWEDTQGTDLHLWPYHREDVYFSTNDVLPSQAFVIWDDNEVITDVWYDAETKRISFTATGNKGNALIGLFDKNATQATVNNSRAEAYWSWHIWCTDSPKRFIQYDDKEDDYEILDRNLGATSANPADGVATYGFFYQFGRKDPLKGYDGIAGDQKKAREQLKYSVNHPTYFFKLNTKTTEWFNDGKSSLATVTADLWGNPAWKFASTANIHPYQALRSELQKTIYDPCPPGYMVPPETAWTGIDEESIVILDNGVIIPTASGDSFYPFSGYISDLCSWEDDSMGYYAYNGCTITRREKRTARVYSSYTGLHSEWDYEHAPNHYGGCSLSVHINDGDPIDKDNLQFEPMYQSNRQRGHNVRCVKEFNN